VRLIDDHLTRRAVIQAGKHPDGAVMKELKDTVSPDLSHSRRVTHREAAAAAATGPSKLSEAAHLSLSMMALVERARGTPSKSSREDPSQSWLHSLQSDSGVIESQDFRDFLASSAHNLLAVREAVLQHGLPLSAENRVQIVESLLEALPEDREVQFDEDTVLGRGSPSRGLSGMMQAVGRALGIERKPFRLSSRSSEYYRSLTLKELLSLRERGKVFHIDHDMSWVRAVISRLGPGEGVNLDDSDPESVDAYLNRVSEFATSLPGVHNSLRVWSLATRLRLCEERTGSAANDETSLFTLLRLPLNWELEPSRSTGEREMLANTRELVSLYSNHLGSTYGVALPDMSGHALQGLLRRGVSDMCVKREGDIDRRLRSLIPTESLARLNAEANLRAGGDVRRWTASMKEYEVNALRDEKKLVFEQTREFWGVDEEVVVRARVKGIESLSVKLFEINTTAVYQETKSEIPTDISLEGLVPAVTSDLKIDRSPFHEGVEEIRLGALSSSRRGVWVLELVGSGMRARCMIRKGSLRLVTFPSSAGHVFRVLNEKNEGVPADAASLWIDGVQYRAESVEHPESFKTPESLRSDAASEIVVPFTGSSSGSKTVVVTVGSAGMGEPTVASGGSSSSAAIATATAASSASSDAASASPAGWSFSSLHSFTHERESYSLECGWSLERQSLVRDNRQARVLIRPRLFLVGSVGKLSSVNLSRLQEVTLTVQSRDVESVEATRVWRDLSMSSGEETSVEFAVPNRVASLTFTLRCKVEIAHTGAKQELSAMHSVSLNEIETTGQTADVFLRRSADEGYSLHVLGKTGEPVPRLRLGLTFENAITSNSTSESLFTDESGKVVLGELPTVASIHVSPNEPQIQQRSFQIGSDRSSFFSSEAFGSEDDEVQATVPYDGASGRVRARLFSVLPKSGGAVSSPLFGAESLLGGECLYLEDLTDKHLKHNVASQSLEVRGLSSGRYVLLHRGSDFRSAGVRSMAVTIAPSAATRSSRSGRVSLRLLADAGCFSRRAKAAPLRVLSASLDSDLDTLVVKTVGGVPASSVHAGSRVHLVVSHFAPDASVDAHDHALGGVGTDSNSLCVETSGGRAQSLYLRSGKLNEEHAYVLARQGKASFPGNTLPRPSLLNVPWSQRTTHTDEQEAQEGDVLEHKVAAAPEMARRRMHGAGGRPSSTSKRLGGRGGRASISASFDFLSQPGVVVSNLRPDASGTVRVKLSSLLGSGLSEDVLKSVRASGGVVTVLATDAFSLSMLRECWVGCNAREVSRGLGMDVSGSGPVLRCYRDLTLQTPLPVTKHFVQKKEVSTLHAGSTTTLTAASDTQAEEYGTVEKALRLLSTLSGDGRVMGEFSWLGRWHTLDEAERRRLYSKYACHEVNLFLFFKDRPWFERVVAPFVSCKRSKTFIDHYVLGHDMSAFSEPGRYSLLNALERGLLAGRVSSLGESWKFSKDRGMQNQLSPQGQERVFNAAISSNALEQEQDDRLSDAVKLQQRLPSPVVAMAASAAALSRTTQLHSSLASPDIMSRKKKASRSPARDRSLRMREEAEEEGMGFAMDDDMPMMEMAEQRELLAADFDGIVAHEDDRASRRRRQLFRAVDKTEELAETHYWRIRLGQTSSRTLVLDSPFWTDFATHQASRDDKPFISKHFAEATRNINELLCAVAVLDLPFVMPAPSSVAAGAGTLSWTATESPLVLFKVDVSEAEAPASTRVLVGQNFFDPSDRVRHLADGSRTEVYLESGEFVRNRVYGVQVVVTNVSSTSRNLRVLMQIPEGALPAQNGFVTRTRDVSLGSYETKTLEYNFYFPFLGEFVMFPAHVSAGEKLEAHAHPVRVRVVATPTVVDKTSWSYIANDAPLEECLEYLSSQNLQTNGVNLRDVAWRCNDHSAYTALLRTLRARGEWHTSLWGYAFKHNDVTGVREFLNHPEGGLTRLSRVTDPRIDSELLCVSSEQGVGSRGDEVAAIAKGDYSSVTWYDGDQTASGYYEHLEYSPLINARAHKLGTDRKIMNTAVAAQYRRLLVSLLHSKAGSVSPAEQLAFVYFLLLQDRVDEAMDEFKKVPAPSDSAAFGGDGKRGQWASSSSSASSSSAAAASSSSSSSSSGSSGVGSSSSIGSASWSTLAYDYMAAYLDFFIPESGLEVARHVARVYTDYPVPRWAAKFAAVASQLREIDAADEAAARGGATRVGGGSESSGKGGTVSGERDEDLGKELIREQQQSSAAGGEPALEMELRRDGPSGTPMLRIVAANVSSLELRYYCMDVEVLFSSKPFVSAGAGAADAKGGFSFVRPNVSQQIKVRDAGESASLRELLIPVDTGVGPNLLIEAVAGGKRRSVTFFASTLDVEILEATGRVRVTRAADGRPIPRAYVKVFGSGSVDGDGDDAFFFKDLYTSATGVADYASVSTDALDRVKRFAILVVSPEYGAVVRTARKPAM
jgi:hypothetical protein